MKKGETDGRVEGRGEKRRGRKEENREVRGGGERDLKI